MGPDLLMVLILAVPQLALQTTGALLIKEENAAVVTLAFRLGENEVEGLRCHMQPVQLDT